MSHGLSTAVAVTVGIDLAAQPKRTSVCQVEWPVGARARVGFPDIAKDDASLVELVLASEKVGIDCPLGWPDAFVASITGLKWPASAGRTLTHRVTDWFVYDELRRRGVPTRPPLSVSTDRIGVVALRCAAMLEELAARGARVDRTGTGVVAEVYPAAALSAWGLRPRTSYKTPGSQETLTRLVADLQAAIPLDFTGDALARCGANHDDFDALISALVARAAHLGQTMPPVDGEIVSREGWIQLPAQPLSALTATA